MAINVPLEAQAIPRFRIREQRAYDSFRKGLRFYHAHHYVAAREFFYKALNVHPYFHLARRYLGDSYYYSGDWAGALEQWEFLSETSQNAYPLVQQRSQLLRFSLGHAKEPDKYVFLRSFHSDTWPGYHFRRPTDLGLGPAGEIYLSSFTSANVLRLSPSGQALQEISGPFYDSLQTPLCTAVSTSGNIYVCDYEEDRVRVFSPEGSELFSFGESGSKDGQFHGPTGLVVHKQAVFVSDAGNHRVQKFNLEGRFLLELGRSLGEEPPLHPTGLAVSKDNTLYLADRDASRILRFDLDGNFLGDIASDWIKKPRGLHISQDTLVIADEESGIIFYNITKQQWSLLDEIRDAQGRLVKLTRPFAARIDATGALYVADYGSNRLLVFVPLGMRISNLNCKIQKALTQNFPQITVFISAENRLGVPLRSLTPHSFSLFENDSPIKRFKIDNIIPYNRRMAIALVKENSPFYQQNYDRYLSSTLNSTLASLRISDMVYLIQAGRDTRLIYQGLERKRILRLLQAKESNQSSAPNLAKGIYEALSHLTKRIGPRSVVLLVSGKHSANAFKQYSFDRISHYALSHAIPIHVLSYEGERDIQKKKEMDELYAMLAQKTKGQYFRAFNEQDLEKLYSLIANKKDQRYILTYNTDLSTKLKGRYIDLRLELEYLGTRGLANAGYFIP